MADDRQPPELLDRNPRQDIEAQARLSHPPAASVSRQDSAADPKKRQPDSGDRKTVSKTKNGIGKRAEIGDDLGDRPPDAGYDRNATLTPAKKRPTNSCAASTSHNKRHYRKGQPVVEVTVEIEYVTGPQAEDLAHRQWTVIKEILQWTADHPTPTQEHPPTEQAG